MVKDGDDHPAAGMRNVQNFHSPNGLVTSEIYFSKENFTHSAFNLHYFPTCNSNSSNNDCISRALFHLKHAALNKYKHWKVKHMHIRHPKQHMWPDNQTQTPN